MKVIIYYGSSRKQNMKRVLDSLINTLKDREHSYVVVDKQFSPCVNCGVCQTINQCCLKDDFPVEELNNSDIIIVLSPIFFFSYNAKTKAFIDRLFSVNLTNKVFTSITLSGSPTVSRYCGFDLIKEILIRTSEYCGSIYAEPLNIVTNDEEIKVIDEKCMRDFVKNLEVCYEAKKGK